jgi:hypothetical protein
MASQMLEARGNAGVDRLIRVWASTPAANCDTKIPGTAIEQAHCQRYITTLFRSE